MGKPTILIFYANASNQAYLKKLAEEGKEIQRILNSVLGREYEVALIPEAGPQNIIDELNVPNREVEIIHYAGHSNQQQLLLNDTDVKASDLSKKLKSHKSLKLVFINGCSSYGQVRLFHQEDIPYVIATSRPIEDEKATWVATQFYLYLTLRKSIKEAFDEIVKDSQLLKKGIDLVIRGLGEYEEDEFKWGLYELNDPKPYYLPKVVTVQAQISHTNFLKKLILSLKKVKSPLNDSYKQTIEEIDTMGNVLDATVLNDLLSILPYPLGIRLRQINGKININDDINEYYQQLLYDYTFFFETLLHYCTSLICCQLWQNKKSISSDNTFTLFNEFICTNRLSQPFETYKSVIEKGIELLSSSTTSIYPNILKAIPYVESNDFKEAATFFNQLKNNYWGKVRLTQAESTQKCYLAQEHLLKCIQSFDFVIENSLILVKEINVLNFRHLERKRFANKVAQLVEPNEKIFRQRGNDKPMENKAILLYKKGIDTEPSINLFPFLLDRNVFSQQSAPEIDLYLFIGFCKDTMLDELAVNKVNSPCYYFVSLKNPRKIWRFDEENSEGADFLHIDENTPHTHKEGKEQESHRQNHLLTNAGELKTYLAEFKKFFLTT